MRLYPLELFSEVETSKDALQNPIYTNVSLGHGKGRMTNWSSEEIALLPREITSTHEKILTTAPEQMCLSAKYVEYRDRTYEVHMVTVFNHRWCLLGVKAYGY